MSGTGLDPVIFDPNLVTDCDTINVTNTTDGGACDGTYTRDPQSQDWVNLNNTQCKLRKVFDPITETYSWTFSVEVEAGETPPTGAVKAVTFDIWPEYEMLSGTYLRINTAGENETPNGFSDFTPTEITADGHYMICTGGGDAGCSVWSLMNFVGPKSNDHPLPSVLFNGDADYKLVEAGRTKLTMGAETALTQFASEPTKQHYPDIAWNAKNVTRGQTGVAPEDFWDTRVLAGNPPTVENWYGDSFLGLPGQSDPIIISADGGFSANGDLLDETQQWLSSSGIRFYNGAGIGYTTSRENFAGFGEAYETGPAYIEQRVPRSPTGSWDHLSQSATGWDPAILQRYCAPPVVDLYFGTYFYGGGGGTQASMQQPLFHVTRYGIPQDSLRYPIPFIFRNRFPDEPGYDPDLHAADFEFGLWQRALAWDAAGVKNCLRAGWYLRGASSPIDYTDDCPADAVWGDGITVTRGSSGGGGDGGGDGNGDGGGDGNGDGGGDGNGDGGGDGNGDGGGGGGSGTETRADYTGKTTASKYKGWVFDERTSAISGPFDAQGITSITTKDNSSEMFCVNQDKEIKKTDLLEFNNPNFPTFTDPYTNITTPFDGEVTKGIVLSETGQGFSYRNRYLSEPFGDSIIGSGTVKMPLFFRNSYLANTETNWMHLGDEHSEKQVYRVDLRFHKNSCGHIWLYVMNDEGLVKGQYKGAIKEHMKVFTNLRGRSFKIQMMIATHYDHPWAMREMAIGHLYGKSF